MRGEHLGAVGELRDHVGAHEARDLEPAKPGARERLDQPDLGVGRRSTSGSFWNPSRGPTSRMRICTPAMLAT